MDRLPAELSTAPRRPRGLEVLQAASGEGFGESGGPELPLDELLPAARIPSLSYELGCRQHGLERWRARFFLRQPFDR